MINELLTALEAGKTLENPEGWKKGGEYINKIAIVLGAIVAIVHQLFPTINVADGVVQYTAGILGGIVILINMYLARATTTKDVANAVLPTSIEVKQPTN